MDPFSALVTLGTSIYGAFAAGEAEEDAIAATEAGKNKRIDYMQQALDAYEANMDKVLNTSREATDEAMGMVGEAGDKSRDLILEMMEKGIEEYAPYKEAGLEALGEIRKDVARPLGESPFYKFQQEQGQKAIDMAFAARGGFGSGAAVEAKADFQMGLGAQEVDKRRAQLNKLAQYGYDASGKTAGLQQRAGEQAAGIGLDTDLAMVDLAQQQGINEANVFGKLGQFQAGQLNQMGLVEQGADESKGQIRADTWGSYADIAANAPTNLVTYDYLQNNNISLNPSKRRTGGKTSRSRLNNTRASVGGRLNAGISV